MQLVKRAVKVVFVAEALGKRSIVRPMREIGAGLWA